MSQLSRPYQLALLAVLVLAGVWMVALRPSAEAGEPGTAAAAASLARPAADPAASPPAPGTTGSSPAPRPRAAPASPKRATPSGDRSKPILETLADGKVAVVVFYEPDGADDRAVRAAVRDLSRRGGGLKVFSASIATVARYAAITRGVSVLTAPTVLVIGPDRQARTVTGLTQTAEIDELVSAAAERWRRTARAAAR